MPAASDLRGPSRVDLEDQVRRCAELVPDAALVVDGEGRLVQVNALAARLFGYDGSALAGERIELLLQEAGRDLVARLADDLGDASAEVPTARGVELSGRRQGGSTFPVEVSIRAADPDPGDGRRLFLSTLRELGEGRRAVGEDVLRTAGLVDSANLGIVGLNLDGSIVSWNGGAEAVLGRSAQEMVGSTIDRLLPPARSHVLRDLLTPDDGRRASSSDLTMTHRDGREVVLSVTPSPIVDRDGRTVGHSLVFLDITERKRIETALAEAKERAENTSREFEAFSYAVAHDLRAPLRAIDGFSQALLEDYPSAIDAEGQGYLAQMRASAKYMGQLIDSLLALARLTNGGIDLQPVDLSELARETVHRFRVADPERRVEVSIRDGVLGFGDRTMLALVLDNLLGNSWKYTRSRDVARIEFDSCTNKFGTTYFVKDNGIGFDMAYSDKLFGVFQRLHPVEAFEGTGIGLATVRKVLQRHGGRIWAYGEVDKGASFLFTLTSGTGRTGACLTCVPTDVCRPRDVSVPDVFPAPSAVSRIRK